MKTLAVLSTGAFLLLASQQSFANNDKRVDVNKARNLEQVEMNRKAPQFSYETMSIDFEENSSNITAEKRRELRDKILSLKRDKGLDQITVAAFSDQSYPPAPNHKLSSRDSDLADKRISSVQSVFNDLEGMRIDVETFNLAEDPNTFEKWFNTADYRLKNALKNNMVADSKSSRNLRLIKDKGEEGSAIIVFRKKLPAKSTAARDEVVNPNEVDSYNKKMKEKRTDIYSE